MRSRDPIQWSADIIALWAMTFVAVGAYAGLVLTLRHFAG